MSRKHKGWIVLASFIALLLAGCRCDNSVIPTFYGIAERFMWERVALQGLVVLLLIAAVVLLN